MKVHKIMEAAKKLFIPGYSDRKVAVIHRETSEILKESASTSRRYNKILKANGVTMRIAIVAGHAEKGK